MKLFIANRWGHGSGVIIRYYSHKTLGHLQHRNLISHWPFCSLVSSLPRSVAPTLSDHSSFLFLPPRLSRAAIKKCSILSYFYYREKFTLQLLLPRLIWGGRLYLYNKIVLQGVVLYAREQFSHLDELSFLGSQGNQLKQ